MGTYKKLRTPIIKPRTQGGTFYTFSSAMEDIGLNVNELKNKVALSHYVLLNIPAFSPNVKYTDKNVGDYTFAEWFENYALNMETVLRNQPTYNFAESLSVSERTFWKFMKKYCDVKFEKDTSDSSYYVETNNVVKAFGIISAGAQRTDEYGIYNETFVQIPSSYGKMKTLFKPTSDKNYHTGKFFTDSQNNYIENVTLDEISESGNLHTGISASAIYDNEGEKCYNVEDENDTLCVDFSLADLREYYNDSTLTYDDLAINELGIDSDKIDQPYEFNAILLYYSIYDSTNKNILATNAYGIMLLESAVEDNISSKYKFPSIEKRKTSNTKIGNSYSFRLNIKTSSIYSGDTVVYDNSTSSYKMSTEFNDVIRNLSAAVETLKSNANLIAKISNDNTTVKQLALQCMDKIENIETDINNIKSGKTKNVSAESVNSSFGSFGSLDASIYLRDNDGRVIGKFDSSTFEYIDASFGTLTSKEISVNDVNTSTLSAANNSVNITNKEKTSSFATFDINGVRTSKDFIYERNSASYDNTYAVNKTDATKFLNSINIAFDSSSGFMIELGTGSDSNAYKNIISPSTGEFSVTGLLALIIASLKNDSTDSTDTTNADDTVETS